MVLDFVKIEINKCLYFYKEKWKYHDRKDTIICCLESIYLYSNYLKFNKSLFIQK